MCLHYPVTGMLFRLLRPGWLHHSDNATAAAMSSPPAPANSEAMSRNWRMTVILAGRLRNARWSSPTFCAL